MLLLRSMKNNCIIVTGVCIITAAIFLANIASADTGDDVPLQQLPAATPYFNMAACVKKAPAGSTFVFDYSKYLDSADIKSVSSIKNQLAAMDSITTDKNFNRRTLSIAITRELLHRMTNNNATYQPDSLLAIIQWAEQFEYFAAFDPANHLFYRSIFGFWLDYVAEKLSGFSEHQPALRHNFKFRYLVTRCKEKNYTISIKVTSSEKFIDNLLYSNWGHLVHATWNESTWALKLGFLAVFALTCQGLVSMVKKIKYRKNYQH